jgi:regulator of RNase E activity RraA
VTAAQVPIQVRGAIDDWVTVAPGDTVVADEDGVVIVPQKVVEDVAQRVAEWSGTETVARQEILRGMRLLDALARFGHL